MSKSMSTSTSKSNYPSKVVWPFRCKWTVDTLPHGQKLSSNADSDTVIDYIETKGLIYFARMLDKIRLKARGDCRLTILPV